MNNFHIGIASNLRPQKFKAITKRCYLQLQGFITTQLRNVRGDVTVGQFVICKIN